MGEVELERNLRLEAIFMPQAVRQRMEAFQRQGALKDGRPSGSLRLAHYTSAEAALSIIKTKRLWARNTTCMSDYGEVQHGFTILKSYFDTDRTKKFADELDVSSPGAAMDAINAFNGWWQNNLFLNIFVASVSEHTQSEDRHGRLSMWRAFGSTSMTRVALVVKIPAYTEAGNALGLIFSPVAYLTTQEVHAVIGEVLANVQNERDFLQPLDRALITAYVFQMLLAGVACLKHEGFHEEREWRAVYAPQIFHSPLMETAIEVVNGVPQHVQKIPFDGPPGSPTADLNIANLIDRVIIGPSPFPWVIYQAFVEELERAGVPDAKEKVVTSGIPIRPGY